MPKRRNPFGDSSPLQLKQHVGKKEVDMGIAKHQNMKSVYERTKELLFSGSKRSFDIPKDANSNDIYLPEDVCMEDEMQVCDRQMHITPSGQLSNPEACSRSTNAFQAMMNARKASSWSGCHCCKGQAASQDRCGFCDKSVCYDCVRLCSSCRGNFCQLCSVMSYEDIAETALCLQCSS
ncbi:apoptosis regulatory protein Siva-like isoform X2 [Dreissena polymorpha]|uniref:apoptosis regulatory protein Siva-like isoform X2 n=1 Tax=Dreissena polymorpha TaxID=45954 RepID=UPI0022653963|nr:apoptosis regulatory protein Siva-like isoform X2 [Dreissena polymorpha]